MKSIFYSLIFLLNSFTLFSQQIEIEGSVYTFGNHSVNNVTVKNSKTKKETFTNKKGWFKIKCEKGDKLIFKANGFEKQVITVSDANIGKKTTINLRYQRKYKSSYKKVINSRHLSKHTLDYCLNHYGENTNKFDSYENIYDALEYVYPQVKFLEVEGLRQVLLIARGVSSVYAGNEALLVVDGIVVTDISSISPMQVKEIKILQGNDAQKWGMRGSNGVVEILLKYGTE